VADHSLAEDLCRMGDEFFGISLTRHSPASLLARLHQLDVCLLAARVDEDLVGIAGYSVNPQNRRQATVSVSTHTVDLFTTVLTAHLQVLGTVARIGSFVSVVRTDSTAMAAYHATGFREVGRLRSRRYHEHRHHDDVILHRAGAPKDDDRP
jgi:hypothetical protein